MEHSIEVREMLQKIKDTIAERLQPIMSVSDLCNDIEGQIREAINNGMIIIGSPIRKIVIPEDFNVRS